MHFSHVSLRREYSATKHSGGYILSSTHSCSVSGVAIPILFSRCQWRAPKDKALWWTVKDGGCVMAAQNRTLPSKSAQESAFEQCSYSENCSCLVTL